jgi:hypothetical protein
MKFFCRIFILLSLFVMTFLGFSERVSAQLSQPFSGQQQSAQPFQQQAPSSTMDGDPVDPCGDPVFDPYCPIDSNLYVLLVLGILYGVWKVKEGRKLESD